MQGHEGSDARLEFPAGFWEAAGGGSGDAANVVWRVAAALHALPLLEKSLVGPHSRSSHILGAVMVINHTLPLLEKSLVGPRSWPSRRLLQRRVLSWWSTTLASVEAAVELSLHLDSLEPLQDLGFRV